MTSATKTPSAARVVKADLTKLARPLCYWLILAAVILSVAYALIFQQAASTQTAYASEQLGAWLADNAQSVTGNAPTEQALSCISYASQAQWDAALIASTQSPLGALGVAAGLMSSGIGLLVLLVLAAAHVAGEWHGQTIKEVIGSSGRRINFILAKTLSLFVYGLGLVLCSWVALILWGLISKQVFPIPHSLSVQETWAWVWPTVVGTPAVIFLFAAFGVALGSMLREIASTVVAAGGLTLLLCYPATYATLSDYSPATWTASAASLYPTDIARWPYRYFWFVDGCGFPQLLGVAVVLGMAVFLCLIASSCMHLHDVV